MTSSRRSVSSNIIFNTIKSVSQILLPLVTYPYLLRILGASNIGKVSYGASIISYFSLIAVLGTNTYAVREGARIRDDKKEVQVFASQIFAINICLTVFSYALLILIIIFNNSLASYRALLLIQSLSILATSTSFEWVNSVFEDFLYITVRSIIINCMQITGIFIFVHKPSDYLVYAFIQTSAVLLISVTNWIYCRKYISLSLPKKAGLSRHFKPLLILFSNNVAVQIYMNIDTVMLGAMTSDKDVGLYSSAVKLYSLVKNILASVYIVPLSRLSYYKANNDNKNFIKLYTNLTSALTIVIIPISTGMFVLSKGLMLILGGSEYAEASITLKILSISFIFALYGGLISQCLNIALRNEKINLLATIGGALLDFIINLLIIKRFHYNGAAFTTLVAELFVLVFCMIRTPDFKNYIIWKKVRKSLLHAVFESMLIVIIYISLSHIITNEIIITIATVIISIASYAVILIVLRDEMLLMIIRKLKNKFIR